MKPYTNILIEEDLSPYKKDRIEELFSQLTRSVSAALETYSNIHRGSGQKSIVTTALFEQARDIVLEYLGLKSNSYVVIFCNRRRAEKLKSLINPGKYKIISSNDIGLPLGVWVLAVREKDLPEGRPLQTGGGTTRLVAPDWIVWAKAPGKFEAGTPSIVNVIAFARALILLRKSGIDSFKSEVTKMLSAHDILYHDKLEQYSGKELLTEFRKTLIGGSVIVPTIEGPKVYINLDNGASTPTFAPVMDAAIQTWRQPEEVKKEIVHEVTSICSGILGAPRKAFDFIFTSNTTEAINLVAESLAVEDIQDFEPMIVNTILEHNSNDLPWRMVPGHTLLRLTVNSDGFVNTNELETLLSDYNGKCIHGNKRITLLAISGASNVLGVFNDLKEISRIAHLHGVRLFVDAAQLVAHQKINIEDCDIDYLAFSAHKVYAPFGSGLLVAKKGLLNFSSGEIDLIKASGEENPGGIAAMGKALVLLERIGFDVIREEESSLTALALRSLSQIEGLKIKGINNPDSPEFEHKGGVIVFELKGLFANVVAKSLSEKGIGVRSGCHCAHLLVKRLLNVSPSLERFQHLIVTLFPGISLPGIVRISLGIENCKEDIYFLIEALESIAKKSTASIQKAASQDAPRPISAKVLKAEMREFTIAAGNKVYTL